MRTFTGPPVFRLTRRPARVSHCVRMRSSTLAGERLYVVGSMSAKSGRAPRRATVPAVAKKLNAVVTTSSPGPTSSAMSAARRASVPDEMPTPCRQPE